MGEILTAERKPMKQQTPEEIKQERDALLSLAKSAQKEAQENDRILRLLVAAGFITDEKIEEARAILRPLN